MDIKFNEPNYSNKQFQTPQSGITTFLIRHKLAKNSAQALVIQLCIIAAFAAVLIFNLFSGTAEKEITPQEAEKAGNPSEIAPR